MSERERAFCRMLKQEGKAKATIGKYSQEVERLKAYLNGRKIEIDVLQAYRTQMLTQEKPQTVNGRLAAVNAYLRFIGRTDLEMKMERIQRSAFTADTRELTQEEYRRLLQAAQGKKNERLALVVQTICATGIRVSELKSITLEAARAGRSEIALKGKNRVVLIPKRLCAKLIRYAKARGIVRGPVFCTRSGKPLDRGNIWRDMKRLAMAAHVDARKVFPHNLRHLFARTYYALEKDIAHLADILGHSSVETTRIYLAMSEKTHARMLERMKLVI